MKWRIASIFVFFAILGAGITSLAFASPRCRGCNVIDEGTFNQSLVGQIVYERTSRGFLPARVERIDTYPPALFWRSADGRGAWNDARSYYSETAYRELVADGRAGVDRTYMAPVTRESRDRLWAVCRAYMSARNRARSGEEVAGLWLMQRGCCQSTDARRFGTPPGAC